MASEAEMGPPPGGREWTEQYADVIEMVGERVGQVITTMGQLARRRPYLAAAVMAASLGAVIGLVLAGRRPRRRAALVQMPRLRIGPPPRPALVVPETARGTLDRAGAAMALVPLGMRLLANPLVRQAIFRMATRAMRGRRSAQ